MGILAWLNTPAPIPGRDIDSFSHTLQSLRIATALQNGGWRQQKALSVAAIFRARQMTADTLGSLPVRAEGNGLVPAPNAEQDSAQFVTESVLSLQDHGEAYWQVDPTNGDMFVLDPNGMDVVWNSANTERLYEYNGRRLRTRGAVPNLVVLSLNRGAGDTTGVGPMGSDRIRGLIAEQVYSQSFFENQAQPTGILAHPGVLDAKESKALYDQWTEGQSSRTTGILTGGMTYNALSFSPQDSEFVETHLIGVGDVATLFGVPSSLLNYNQPGSSITYASSGSIWESYWRQTLAPTYGRRIERAWSQVLGAQVKFDPEELFLATLRERGEVAVQLVGAGYDPADSLDITGLPPMKHTGVVADVANVQG